MKQVFFVLSISLFAFCHSNNVVSSRSDTAVTQAVPASVSDTNQAQKPVSLIDSSFFEINSQFPWLGDTIRSYIQLSTNDMTKLFVKDSSIVFMYDGYEKTATGGYVSVRLGADRYNGEGTVFTTAEVISVDVLSREISIYDIAADSSYIWARPQ